MLYQIIIYPIEVIIEMVYFLCMKIIRNHGFSIIGVSLAVQILSLPLYNIAEKWQIREREIQKGLKLQIDRIKGVFKGDEQYMILSTYYRQEHYHPIFALRSTVSLFIQVPFFIAAYTFLSNLTPLIGKSFYFIPDLGAPDALFTIGSFTVNILPIAMTLVNIIAGAVYTKGFPLKEKIQLYAMAVLFLVLLYNSPSGLVLYWTLNNVFSLCKNIIGKTAKPARTAYIVAVVGSIILAIIYLVLFKDFHFAKKILVWGIVAFILAIPLILSFIRRIFLPQIHRLSVNSKQRNKLFACACIGLFLLAGFFIPSALTASSPQEFSFIGDYTSPLQLLLFPLFQAAGVFLFWLPTVYLLFPKSIKNVLTWSLISIFTIALINTFILTGDYGVISATLQFDKVVSLLPKLIPLIIDGLVILTCAILGIVLIKFGSFKISVSVYGLLCASLLLLGSANYVSTQKSYIALANMLEETGELEQAQSIEPVYNLSKDEQNVVVIMLDRGIGSFVSQIFEELPETAKQFDGFTWYPNTLSMSATTLMGAPPLYGGYEYTPNEINERENETLVSKHNESLTVLPLLFSEHGFTSTITDASWANYSWTPDNTIFDPWIDIVATNLADKYTSTWFYENDKGYVANTILKNNFLFFSFFRMFPASLRGGLYADGIWWKIDKKSSNFDNFLFHYASLYYLLQLTEFTAPQPSFNFIKNNTTHEPTYLQYPEYELRQDITNIGPNPWNDKSTLQHYHANVAALKELGEWFNYLRDNNVYDNTRIIIVSDHGRGLLNLDTFSQFDDLNPASFNPLLLVKDFNMNDTVKTDMTFMTNADVPFLATEGVIENAKNPFTNAPFSMNVKENGITVYTNGRWDPKDHNENTFILDGETWHVKDNIFIPENWSKVE